MSLRLAAPGRGFATAWWVAMCAVSLLWISSGTAVAQPKKSAPPKPAAPAVDGRGAHPAGSAAEGQRGSIDKKPKEKTFDFNNLNLNGQLRTPQLLYFLERANEELERASLEKRSFIPHIVRSVEEEAL